MTIMDLKGCINVKTILGVLILLILAGFLFKKEVMSVINTDTQCYQ